MTVVESTVHATPRHGGDPSASDRDRAPARLRVEGLRVAFGTGPERREVVRGVSFDLAPGEVVAIVGESGSGKSVTCLTVMGLNDSKFASSTGEVLFRGEDLLKASPSRLRAVRGDEIAW